MRPVMMLLVALLTGPGQAAVDWVWDAAEVGPEGWAADGDRPAIVAAQAVETVDLFGRLAISPAESGGLSAVQPVGSGWSALTVSVVLHVPQTASGWQGLVGRDRTGGSAGDTWSLLLDPDGQWSGRLATDQGRVSLDAPAAAGWHQVAMTWDGALGRLLVDGRIQAEAPLAGALLEERDTPFSIGSYADGQLPFSGAIARVELRDEAMSADALAAAWAAWQADHPEADGFTFAEASDIHVTDTRSTEIVNRAVDAINADPAVRFSLWLGDLTRASTPDEMVLARLTLDRLTQPRYTVRGNHDQQPGIYEAQFGPLNQVFEVAGWKFILLDTNPGDKTPLRDESVAWLREQIAATAADMPIVLCSHHPLMPHTKTYRLAGADDLLALFEGHNLKACLSGHFHGNQDEVVDGVLFTTTKCLSTTRGNHDGTEGHGYRLFHCRDGEITTDFAATE